MCVVCRVCPKHSPGCEQAGWVAVAGGCGAGCAVGAGRLRRAERERGRERERECVCVAELNSLAELVWGCIPKK